MLSSTRKNEIRSKAVEVENESEKYQLIHAAYACQSIIRDTVADYFKQKYNELAKEIEKRHNQHLDIDSQLAELNTLKELQKKYGYHVDVDYIDMLRDHARIVKTENAFVVYLPKELENKALTENGGYNYEVINKIRHFMAHELGHLVLHTKDILQISGTQGSIDIKDEEKESEANFFGEELLNLRKMRNKKILEDGGAHTLF